MMNRTKIYRTFFLAIGLIVAWSAIGFFTTSNFTTSNLTQFNFTPRDAAAPGPFAPGAAVHAQERSVVWERFDVDIEILPDGTFEVTEHQTIRFIGGDFTEGFGEILKHNLGHISDWQMVDAQGNVYQEVPSVNEPYTFMVEETSRMYTVVWRFPPIANETATYSLSYRVHDALRYYEGGDQLWWKAIVGDRVADVLEGQVRVVVPQAASIQEWAAYINERDGRDSITANVIQSGQAVIFDLDRSLRSGEEMEVRVEFTPGIVDGAVQPWQEQADAAVAAREAELARQERWGPILTLLFLLVGALFTLGGPAGLYVLWYRLGRDNPAELVADYLPEPPSTLPPGMAGTLLDETVDMNDIIATLVDLARRKAISITEVKEEGFFRNSTDFIYRRERDDVKLLPYEQKLLDALFSGGREVRLSALRNKFYAKINGIKSEMYKAVIEAKLFDRNPDSVRKQYGIIGILIVVGAVFLSSVLMNAFGDLAPTAWVPAFGLGVTGVGMLILSRFMARKTDFGAEEAAAWQAFRSYLRDIDKYSDLEAQKEIWDRYLPYAIAFGIDRGYMRKFEQIDAPAPGWYIPSPTLYGPYRRRYFDTRTGPVATGGAGRGRSRPVLAPGGPMGSETRSAGGTLGDMSQGMGGSLSSMSAGLGSMLSSASNTLTSRPSNSSSGGGWSGGRGFSGGGSRGGGGGGGGSRGFR